MFATTAIRLCASATTLAVLVEGCASHQHPSSPTTTAVVASAHKPVLTPQQTPQPTPRLKVSATTQKRCLQLIARVTPVLQQLASLAKSNDDAPFHPDISAIAALTPRDCTTANRYKALPLLQRWLSRREHNTGIILPLSGKYAPLGQAFLAGIHESFGTTGVRATDSSAHADGALRAFADLIWHDNMGVLITGMVKEEAQAVLPYINALGIPTLIVNRNYDIIANNSYAFQVYPTPQHEAAALATHATTHYPQGILVARPSDGHSDILIESLRQELAKQKRRIILTATYDAGDYTSMRHASSKLTARLRGNHRYAVLIPDNFRIVRYFIKLMAYQRATEVALLGNHEWRSQALLDPWEPTLDQSYFADYIGTYDQLPFTVPKHYLINSTFAHEDHASQIDLKYIGYRVGTIASRITQFQAPMRRSLRIATENATMSSLTAHTKSEIIFNSERVANWPTYGFQIVAPNKESGTQAKAILENTN